MSKSDQPQAFDVYMREAIKSAGISQADLSRKTGIDQSLLSKWSRGLTAAPDLPNLRRLAAGLRVPLLQLAVAAGHLTADEAKLRDHTNVFVAAPMAGPWPADEAISADPHLSDEARVIILGAYQAARERPVVSDLADHRKKRIPKTEEVVTPSRKAARAGTPRKVAEAAAETDESR